MESHDPGRGLPSPGRGWRSAASGRLRRRRIWGGGGSWRPPRPGSGPHPRRARSAVLPRSSPMLIFGLGCPCPGISRHASRRPVRRPEPRREEGSLGQRRRRRLPGPSMSPRRTLPRPFSLCLCVCLAAAATRGAAQSGKFGLPPRHPHPSHHDRAELTWDRDPGSPPSAVCIPFSLLRGPPRFSSRGGACGTVAPRAGGVGRLEGGQGWLRPRRREASGCLADTLSRPRSEPEPSGGSRPARAPEGGAWRGGRQQAEGTPPPAREARGPRRGPLEPPAARRSAPHWWQLR